MRRANGRSSGRVGGKPRAMRDIIKAFRRPHRFARCRLACATGTAASQGFRTASRMARDAPHHRATRVFAEIRGTPSRWVNINAPWYKHRRRPGQAHPGRIGRSHDQERSLARHRGRAVRGLRPGRGERDPHRPLGPRHRGRRLQRLHGRGRPGPDPGPRRARRYHPAEVRSSSAPRWACRSPSRPCR